MKIGMIAWCLFAASPQAEKLSLVRSLASIEIEYVEDGAADASVTERPTPNVKAVVDLRDEALPLLIDCLDSCIPTKSVAITYRHHVAERTQVPLGYVCLDVLLSVTKGAHYAECADDGFGACVKDGYYFRPDVYSKPQAQATVSAVQKNWRSAFDRGHVTFVYPKWWE